MDQNRCPFCQLERSRISLTNDVAAAFLDAFPVAEGRSGKGISGCLLLTARQLHELHRQLADLRGQYEVVLGQPIDRVDQSTMAK